MWDGHWLNIKFHGVCQVLDSLLVRSNSCWFVQLWGMESILKTTSHQTRKKFISFLSPPSDTLPRDHWKLIGQKMTMHFYVEEFAHSEFFLLRLLKSFSISQVWLSDTCQSNFAIADISGGSWHYVDNKRCPMINLADKQFNPKGSKVVQTWSLNGKVDNWHLMLATLELDVTFENIYAVTDHWLNFPSPQRILKGKAYSLAGCDVWKEEE